MTDFGERLRNARIHAMLTQEDLGREAGVSPITVNRLENDGPGSTNPRPETVKKLASALNVSPAWLMFGDDQAGKSAA